MPSTIVVPKARIAALLTPLVLYTLYYHHYYASHAEMGKAAFIAWQAARYDAYFQKIGWYVPFYSASVTVIALVAMYELTAALLAKWWND